MPNDSHVSQEPRFEPGPLLRLLEQHGVRFVVIGGLAGNLHGSTSVTLDLDICYSRATEDLKRLAAALLDLDVTLRGADSGLPFRPDVKTLRAGLNFTFDTQFGPFDCLGEASGYTYEVLAPNAIGADLGGYRVQAASLDDLIRMKRAAGRLKDLNEVANLEKLREVREQRGLFGLAEPVVASRRSITAQRPSRGRAKARPRSRK